MSCHAHEDRTRPLSVLPSSARMHSLPQCSAVPPPTQRCAPEHVPLALHSAANCIRPRTPWRPCVLFLLSSLLLSLLPCASLLLTSTLGASLPPVASTPSAVLEAAAPVTFPSTPLHAPLPLLSVHDAGVWGDPLVSYPQSLGGTSLLQDARDPSRWLVLQSRNILSVWNGSASVPVAFPVVDDPQTKYRPSFDQDAVSGTVYIALPSWSTSTQQRTPVGLGRFDFDSARFERIDNVACPCAQLLNVKYHRGALLLSCIALEDDAVGQAPLLRFNLSSGECTELIPHTDRSCTHEPPTLSRVIQEATFMHLSNRSELLLLCDQGVVSLRLGPSSELLASPSLLVSSNRTFVLNDKPAPMFLHAAYRDAVNDTLYVLWLIGEVNVYDAGMALVANVSLPLELDYEAGLTGNRLLCSSWTPSHRSILLTVTHDKVATSVLVLHHDASLRVLWTDWSHYVLSADMDARDGSVLLSFNSWKSDTGERGTILGSMHGRATSASGTQLLPRAHCKDTRGAPVVDPLHGAVAMLCDSGLTVLNGSEARHLPLPPYFKGETPTVWLQPAFGGSGATPGHVTYLTHTYQVMRWYSIDLRSGNATMVRDKIVPVTWESREVQVWAVGGKLYGRILRSDTSNKGPFVPVRLGTDTWEHVFVDGQCRLDMRGEIDTTVPPMQLGSHVYFMCMEGLMSVPLDSPLPVMGVLALPPAAWGGGPLVAWEVDEVRQQIWIKSQTGELLFDPALPLPWTSQVRALPAFDYPYTAALWAGRDSTLDVHYTVRPRDGCSTSPESGSPCSWDALMIDGTGGVSIFPLPFPPSLQPPYIMADSRRSVAYAYVRSAPLVALFNQWLCMPGYAWNADSGMCERCAAGSRWDEGATLDGRRSIPTCQPCEMGSVAPLPGSLSCDVCPAGQYQASILEQVCSSCTPGFHQPHAGASGCVACTPGRYSDNIRADECTACAPGSYSTQNHSTVCLLCDKGSASPLSALTSPCPQCPSGSESPILGGQQCTACPPGSSAANGGFCNPCSAHTYTPRAGSVCVSCSGEHQEGLHCQSGMAAVEEGWWAYEQWDTSVQEQVWRTTACPVSFCPDAQLSMGMGGASSNGSSGIVNGTARCLSPRLDSPSNWLCAECESGYLPWGPDCLRCTGVDAARMILSMLYTLAVVLFLLRSAACADGDGVGALSVLLYFAQTAALQTQPRRSYLTWLHIVNPSADAVGACMAPLTPMQQAMLTMMAPVLMVATLACIAGVHACARACVQRGGAAQRMSTAVPSVLSRVSAALTWDVYVSCTVGILLFCYTSVSVAAVESLHCVTLAPGVERLFESPTVDCESDGYRTFRIFVVLWIVLYVVGLPVAILVALTRARARGQLHPVPDPSALIKGPAVGAAASGDGGERSVQPDATFELDVMQHPSTDVYAEASPSSSASSLVTRASAPPAALRPFERRWGSLYLCQSASGWFWQPAQLLRRFCFALAAVLLSHAHATRYALFCVLHIASLLLLIGAHPFKHAKINRAEAAAHVLLFLMAQLLGASSAVSGPSPSTTVQVLTLLLIGLPLCAFVALLLHDTWRKNPASKLAQWFAAHRAASFLLGAEGSPSEHDAPSPSSAWEPVPSVGGAPSSPQPHLRPARAGVAARSDHVHVRDVGDELEPARGQAEALKQPLL